MMALVFFIVFNAFTFNSPDGHFYGVARYRAGSGLETDVFTLHAQNGEVVFTVEHPGAHTFYISERGTVFGLSDAALYFYGAGGETAVLRQLNYPNGFGFSGDNTVFYASDRDGIFLYSLEGVGFDTCTAGRLFACTAFARHAAVVSNDTLYVYAEGEVVDIWQLSTPYARSLVMGDGQITVEEPKAKSVFDLPVDENSGEE